MAYSCRRNLHVHVRLWHSKVLSEKSDSYLDGYLGHTSQKLLLPLVLAMIAGAVLLLLDGSFSLKSIYINYRQGKTLLCNHSWYVFELYAFALIFWTSAKVSSKKNLPMVILAATALMYVVMRWLLHWEFFWYLSSFGFPLGFFFAYHEQEIRDLAKRHGVVIYGALAICSLLLFGGYALTKNAEFRTLPQTAIGLIAVMCSWILPVPSRGRVLYWLGVISFELYLVHGFVRNYLIKWGGIVLPEGALRGMIIIAASILVATAFHFVIKMIEMTESTERR